MRSPTAFAPHHPATPPSAPDQRSRKQSGQGKWQTESRKREAGVPFGAEVFLEASRDAIVGVNTAGEITYVNSSAEVTFGWVRGELLQRPVEMLIPEARWAIHAEHRAKFLVSPRARPMAQGLDLWARRKDGSEFPVAVSLAPVETRGGLIIFATVVDMTAARARLETVTQARDREPGRPGQGAREYRRRCAASAPPTGEVERTVRQSGPGPASK